jgi:hypothetical protein
MNENKLVITQMNRYYVVDSNGVRLPLLNVEALIHYLKKLGFTPAMRAAVFEDLDLMSVSTWDAPSRKAG